MSGTRVPATIGVFVPSDPQAQHSVLIHEGLALQASGAEILDLDTIAVGRRLGAFAEADDDTIALLIAGLVAVNIQVCVTTDSPALAGLAAEHGAAWVIDPSGGSAGLDRRFIESDCGIVIGPWGYSNATTAADVPGAYAEGLVRHAGRLLERGIDIERVCLDAGAGLSASDPEPWRMLNELDRLIALGYPLLVPATEDFLTEMVADESAEQRLDDAAIALAVLASSVGAWALRTHRIGVVSGMIRRMHASPVITGT